MTGTLARLLAGKQIETGAENFWADVQGDIEEVNGVLKITEVRVDFHLMVPRGKQEDVKEIMATYLTQCPAAQSVAGCIQIKDRAIIEEIG
jgi:hypothetical protein